MSKLVALLLYGEFHWGFSVRFPLASMSESFPEPPPTTLVGALARGLAEAGLLSRTELYLPGKSKELAVYSNAASIINSVKVATFCYEISNKSMPVPYADPLRLLRTLFIKENNRARREMWFGFAKSGRTYAPATKFKLLYILDIDKLSEICGSKVSTRDLVRACFSIPCIGSKEGIVSIYRVECSSNVRTYSSHAETVRTQFYVPIDAVSIDTVRGDYVIVSLPYPVLEWYQVRASNINVVVASSLRDFLVPCRQGVFIEPTYVEFYPSKESTVYKCVMDSEHVTIAWSRP